MSLSPPKIRRKSHLVYDCVFQSRNKVRMVVAGNALPSVELFQGFPDVKKINIADYVKGKNVIIVGLPGAFTPT